MPDGRRLTSKELATLIADSLINAGLISKERLREAVEVISVDLDARKGVGDY
jgi:hypothetical protein